MKYALLLLLLAFGLTATAQDISGKWSGNHGPMLNPQAFERIEMNIVQRGGQLTGTSKCINTRTGEYSLSQLVGTLAGKKATMYEDKLIEYRVFGAWCLELHMGELTVDSSARTMTIRGTTRTHRHYDSFRDAYTVDSCSPGYFIITKPFIFTEEKTATVGGKIPETPKPIVEPPTERRLNVLQTFNVASDSLTLSFYDDSDVDGDTVTVYYNKKMMLDRRLLSDKPLTITISVIPGMDNELVMFANNVGSIPPNTAVLVFYDNGNRHEIRIDSDTKKSGTILIKKNN